MSCRDDGPSSSAITFPLEDGSESKSFEDVCAIAAIESRPVVLLNNSQVHLKSGICLRKQESLVLRSELTGCKHPCESNRNDLRDKDLGKPTISGNLHTLFTLNNSSSLTIEGISLFHTRVIQEEGEDHRNVGAAINVRNKASLTLRNVMVSSLAGFCCWVVKNSVIHLERCTLTAPLRSALVCFGRPKCDLSHCTIRRAGVHAVCARGECHVRLRHCNLIESTVRAVYAYANASVILEHCRVSGTMRKDKAAIEMSSDDSSTLSATASTNGGSSSTLTIRHCRIFDNSGAGIRISGPIDLSCDDDTNVVECNAGGNIDQRSQLEEDVGSNNVVLRDKSGSSFRQGDWWCSTCIPRNIIVGNRSKCSQCDSEKKSSAMLSEEEIIQLNSGVDIRFGNTEDATNSATAATWWFDGGDDKGWIEYDLSSSEILEKCFSGTNPTSRENRVVLCNGKYEVDMRSMIQINTASEFPRYVRRRAG